MLEVALQDIQINNSWTSVSGYDIDQEKLEHIKNKFLISGWFWWSARIRKLLS